MSLHHLAVMTQLSGIPILCFRILGGEKKILGCSSKMCNEAIWGDMGLETLQSRRYSENLKWLYKVCSISQTTGTPHRMGNKTT